MEDDDVGEIDLVEPRRLADGPARVVHEGLGLQQNDPLAADIAFACLALKTAAERREWMPPADGVGRHEADIVALPGIGTAGITEADEKLHSRGPAKGSRAVS